MVKGKGKAKAKANSSNRQAVVAKQPKQSLSFGSSLPVAYSSRFVNQSPMVNRTSHKSVRIRNTELVGTITPVAEVGLAQWKFSINPGLVDVFPWLSGVAINYESYKFHALKIHVVPTAGTAAPGFVAMAFDYDAMDPMPETVEALLSFEGAVMGALSNPCVTLDMDIKASRKLGPERYIRYEGLIAGDAKTYDVASFNLYADGMAIASQATTRAYVVIEYDIELMTPQSRPIEEAALALRAEGELGVTNVNSPWLGSQHEGGRLPVLVSSAQTGKLGLCFDRAGEYVINLILQGTGIPAGYPTVTGSNSTVTQYNAQATSTVGQYSWIMRLVDNVHTGLDRPIPLPGGSLVATNVLGNINFALAGWMTTLTRWFLLVTRYAEGRKAANPALVLLHDPAHKFVLAASPHDYVMPTDKGFVSYSIDPPRGAIPAPLWCESLKANDRPASSASTRL